MNLKLAAARSEKSSGRPDSPVTLTGDRRLGNASTIASKQLVKNRREGLNVRFDVDAVKCLPENRCSGWLSKLCFSRDPQRVVL